MTSPLPLPASASRPPSPSPAPASSYTHAQWLQDMVPPAGHIAGIRRDLEVMAADLRDVQAGRTHMRLVDECLADADEFLAWLMTFVAATDAAAVPMFEAIQNAGGQDEVAKSKDYHDRT